MTSLSLNSPNSVRSQMSFGAEETNEDGLSEGRSNNPLSQVQFATQVPFPIGSTDHEMNGSRTSRPTSLRATSPGQDILAALFTSKKGLSLQSAQAETKVLLSSGAAASSDAVGSPRLLPANEPAVDDQEFDPDELEDGSEEKEDEEEDEELSQAEITVHNEEALGSTISVSAKNVHRVSGAEAETLRALPPMPTAMLEIMRAFRNESRNGRYIPRCLQQIPKVQEDLLKADESWQPPLIGKPERLGTVPQDLLNTLIEHADRAASSIEVGTIRFTDQIESSGDAGREEAIERPGGKQSPLTSSDASAGSEFSTQEWTPTPSPQRPRRGLPPDSPTEIDERSNSNNGRPCSEDSATGDVIHSLSVRDQAVAKPTLQPESQYSTIVTKTNQGSITRDEIQAIRPLISDATTERRDQSNPSTQIHGQRNKNSVLNGSVKVHRTPYPPHQPKSLPLITQSYSPATACIPATWDDGPNANISKTKKNDMMLTDATHRGDTIDFEVNSSEDEEREYAITPGLSASTGAGRQKQTSDRAKVAVRSSPLQSRKRRFETATDKSGENQLKRSRVTLQQDEDGRKSKSTLSTLDDEIRRDRRKFHQDLQQKVISTNHVQASIVREASQVASANSASLDLRVNDSKVSSIAKAIDGASASDTHPSVHAAASSNYGKSPLPKVTFDSPKAKNAASSSLFTDFKETYPDYGGQPQHFIAACQLLKSLRDKSKATHPSLWDDFVFRHFHDYRSHLQEVMETCGNAMPYEVFYENCVEQPTHYKRVIRPAHLEMPMPLLGPATLHTDTVEHHPDSVSSPVQAETRFREVVSNNEQEEPTIQERQATEAEAVKSHESAQSVHLWLERAAGAESPELGTPVVSVKHNNHVPLLDLQHPDYTSLSRTKDIIVPRPLLRASSGSSKSKPRPKDGSDKHVVQPAIQTPRNTSSMPEPTTSSKPQSKATKTLANPSPRTSISSQAQAQAQIQVKTKDRPASTFTSKPRVSLPTSQPPPSAKSSSNEKGKVNAPSHRSQEVDTIFSRFVRDYNNLACEKGAQVDDPYTQYVDLSWITNDYRSMRHTYGKRTS